jgi:hypothetical protein
MSRSKSGRVEPLFPSSKCFSRNVVDIQKILYCVGSVNCHLCGDKRLMIIDRIIDGDYSDEELSQIINILFAVK